MKPWSAVVFALPVPEEGGMASRVPPFLHPVAGRPLVWHTVTSLYFQENAPSEVVVVAAPELLTDLFADLHPGIRIVAPEIVAREGAGALGELTERVVVTRASAFLTAPAVCRLVAAEPGAWLGRWRSRPAAVVLPAAALESALQLADPLGSVEAIPPPPGWAEEGVEAMVVRTRADLAVVHRRVRDQLVRNLMDVGVTFILPESVVVDVEVRIGRDSVVYPGVVLEGQTTIGEETVIGPGCRIIDSWIGSGVELKGWNYIAHTSVRNRAILEPYVRRGFD